MIPLYENAGQPPKPIDLSDYTPTLGESVSASFKQAWTYNPTAIYLDMPKIAGPQFFEHAFDSTTSDVDIVNAISMGESTGFEPPQGIDIARQQERIDEAGLAGIVHPDPAYTDEALDTIIAARRLERSRSLAAANAPAWHLPFSLMGAFAAGLTDPVNLATAFLPIVEPASIAATLGMAGRSAGLVSRAISGGIAGGTASAIVEPAIAAGQNLLQAEYGPVNSLVNISAGAILGAAIQPAAGMVSDFIAMRRGNAPFWMYAPKTEQSEAFARTIASEIEAVRHSARPGQNAKEVAEQAAKAASQVDAQIRYMVQQEGISLSEAYQKYGFEIRDGELVSRNVAEARAEVEAAAKEMARLDSEGLSTYEAGLAHTRAELKLQEASEARAAEWREILGEGTLYAKEKVKSEVTNLDEKERKPNPKAIREFIDLEPLVISSANKEELTSTVAALIDNNWKKSRERIENWAFSHYPKNGTYIHAGTNMKVIVDGYGIRSMLNHGCYPSKMLLTAHIPELIQSGVHLIKHVKKKRPNVDKADLSSHFLAHKVTINGRPFVATIILREDSAGTIRFYDAGLSSDLSRLGHMPTRSATPNGETESLNIYINRGDSFNVSRSLLDVNNPDNPLQGNRMKNL